MRNFISRTRSLLNPNATRNDLYTTARLVLAGVLGGIGILSAGTLYYRTHGVVEELKEDAPREEIRPTERPYGYREGPDGHMELVEGGQTLEEIREGQKETTLKLRTAIREAVDLIESDRVKEATTGRPDLEENPYAFREGNPEYQEFFSDVKWDFSLVVRDGDTLGTIAREVYGDREKWKMLFDNNNFDEAKRDKIPEKKLAKYSLHNADNDPDAPLTPGTKLLIYLDFDEKEKYEQSHPEREIGFWSRPQ